MARRIATALLLVYVYAHFSTGARVLFQATTEDNSNVATYIATPMSGSQDSSQGLSQCSIAGNSQLPSSSSDQKAYPLTVPVKPGQTVRLVFANGGLDGGAVVPGQPAVIVSNPSDSSDSNVITSTPVAQPPPVTSGGVSTSQATTVPITSIASSTRSVFLVTTPSATASGQEASQTPVSSPSPSSSSAGAMATISSASTQSSYTTPLPTSSSSQTATSTSTPSSTQDPTATQVSNSGAISPSSTQSAFASPSPPSSNPVPTATPPSSPPPQSASPPPPPSSPPPSPPPPQTSAPPPPSPPPPSPTQVTVPPPPPTPQGEGNGAPESTPSTSTAATPPPPAPVSTPSPSSPAEQAVPPPPYPNNEAGATCSLPWNKNLPACNGGYGQLPNGKRRLLQDASNTAGATIQYVALVGNNTVPGFTVPNTTYGVPYVEFSAVPAAVTLNQAAVFNGTLITAPMGDGSVALPLSSSDQSTSSGCRVNVKFVISN